MKKSQRRALTGFGYYNSEWYKVTLLFDHTTTPNEKKYKTTKKVMQVTSIKY